MQVKDIYLNNIKEETIIKIVQTKKNSHKIHFQSKIGLKQKNSP